MTMQIAKIILYSHDGRIRELPMEVGQLNVITGASKTGKSALIDIVDYCMGRGDCYVAEGVIRKHVSWFAVISIGGQPALCGSPKSGSWCQDKPGCLRSARP